MQKLHGLKAAVGTYQKNHKQFLCVIYLDTEDGTIWTDVFRDVSSFDARRSKTVHDLNTHIQDATGSTAVNMESIRKTAEYVRKLYRERS